MAAHNLPRRRPANTSAATPSVDSIADSMSSISLNKSSTFQVTSQEDSELLEPFLNGLSLPNLPPRSTTCPKALEDLLIGAGERRTVELLKRVEDAIARNAELSSVLREPESLPSPRPAADKVDTTPTANSRRSSVVSSAFVEDDRDSGIGSSISSPSSEDLDKMDAAGNNTPTPTTSQAAPGSQRTLSEYAQKQIHKFIIEPILKEQSLEDFHPLIKEVPSRIGSKEIRTLRDLEKTLIFLAPDYSDTPAAYRSFCETSIRCLHLTVNNVHESDRTLPSDRPYTTGYFLDLVEQIRRYAQILAATREKEARGEALDEMDLTPTDRVELQGGMSQNGKPAILTVVKENARINLADGKTMTSEEIAAASAKRQMEEEEIEDDDGALRSMARRKKNEPIKTYYCKRDGCTKQFKRPCDLTKHIKTHERPFKCPELDCKYHELGWPTEKECDRHVNDKHSDTPTMYRCLEPGCPYTSKRESNCKQHMEKAHNIPYVRSKNNGKGKAPVTRIPKFSPSVVTDSAMGSPFSPPALSPSVNSTVSPGPGATVGASSASSIAQDFEFTFDPDFTTHFNMDYLQPSPSGPITPSWTDDRRESAATSVTDYSPLDMDFNLNTFDESILKTEDYDFVMYNDFQQMPSDPLFPGEFEKLSQLNQQQFPATADLSNFSPIGQDSAMTGNIQETMGMNQGFNNDFQLYNSVAGPSSSAQRGYPNQIGTDGMNGQYQSNSQSQGQTDLMTLFPELAGSH